nr:DUF664 domain-containing protein [Streptosporangium roseum]
MPLCWAVDHMNSEYARRNGRADLIREHIDGATGVRPTGSDHSPGGKRSPGRLIPPRMDSLVNAPQRAVLEMARR